MALPAHSLERSRTTRLMLGWPSSHCATGRAATHRQLQADRVAEAGQIGRMAPVPAVDGMAWSQAGRTSRVRSGRPDGEFDPFRPCAADPLNPAGRKRKMFVHCSK